MRKMQSVNIKDIIRWASIYLILLFSSGFFFRDNMGTRALVMIGTSAFVLMISYGIKLTQESRKFLITFTGIAILVLFSSILAQDELKRVMIFFIGYASALIISLSVGAYDYMNLYVKVLRCLMVFSLIINSLEIVQIHGYYFLPSITLNGNSHFMFLTNIRDYGSQIRNASIFWEPGAYQTFLVVSYIFELKVKQKHYGMFRWLIIISLITTLSTTGIICAFILLICQIIEVESNESNPSRLKRLLILIIAIAAILLFGFQYFSDRLEYLISRNMTTKLRLLFSDSKQDASSTVRRDSMIYPFKMFLSNPIFGVGTSGLNSISDIAGHTMLTCTWLNWFARSGIIYGLFMITGLWKFITFGFQTKTIKILTFVALVLSISSENYIDNPMIIVLSLYGFIIPYQDNSKEQHENGKNNLYLRNERSI